MGSIRSKQYRDRVFGLPFWVSISQTNPSPGFIGVISTTLNQLSVSCFKCWTANSTSPFTPIAAEAKPRSGDYLNCLPFAPLGVPLQDTQGSKAWKWKAALPFASHQHGEPACHLLTFNGRKPFKCSFPLTPTPILEQKLVSVQGSMRLLWASVCVRIWQELMAKLEISFNDIKFDFWCRQKMYNLRIQSNSSLENHCKKQIWNKAILAKKKKLNEHSWRQVNLENW